MEAFVKLQTGDLVYVKYKTKMFVQTPFFTIVQEVHEAGFVPKDYNSLTRPYIYFSEVLKVFNKDCSLVKLIL